MSLICGSDSLWARPLPRSIARSSVKENAPYSASHEFKSPLPNQLAEEFLLRVCPRSWGNFVHFKIIAAAWPCRFVLAGMSHSTVFPSLMPGLIPASGPVAS